MCNYRYIIHSNWDRKNLHLFENILLVDEVRIFSDQIDIFHFFVCSKIIIKCTKKLIMIMKISPSKIMFVALFCTMELIKIHYALIRCKKAENWQEFK